MDRQRLNKLSMIVALTLAIPALLFNVTRRTARVIHDATAEMYPDPMVIKLRPEDCRKLRESIVECRRRLVDAENYLKRREEKTKEARSAKSTAPSTEADEVDASYPEVKAAEADQLMLEVIASEHAAVKAQLVVFDALDAGAAQGEIRVAELEGPIKALRSLRAPEEPPTPLEKLYNDLRANPAHQRTFSFADIPFILESALWKLFSH